jgi:predicted helicase
MLLAYYIAAINIETAYRGAKEGTPSTELDGYEPFSGIVLTDTFQMNEADDSMDTVFFPRNNERADRQKALDIRVIVGNPPYSVGQSSQNDDNANIRYPTLDASLERTYAKRSTATNKNSLYDSYVRALRWASNRILSSPDGGVVGFVTNGGWIDGNTADGIRHTLADEFHHVYVFNLRGNQRTSGEQSRREGGKVFGSGSRNTVAITLLVRKPGTPPSDGAQIHYRDIGDYLTRDDKLTIVDQATVETVPWRSVIPNHHADWLGQRSDAYRRLLALSAAESGIFQVVSSGIKTNRDAWVFDSSLLSLRKRSTSMIDFLHSQREHLRNGEPLDRDPTMFSWSGATESAVAGNKPFISPDFRPSLFRPFFPQHLAFSRSICERAYRVEELWRSQSTRNQAIGLVGTGSRSPFSPLACDTTPSLHLINSDATVFAARWRHPSTAVDASLLDDSAIPNGHGHVSNINPAGLARFQKELGDDVTDDVVFHYVYGVLHSPDFRSEFEVNLKREAPRIPFVTDRAAFDAFVAAGSELMKLHTGFDDPGLVGRFPLVDEWADGIGPDHPDFDPVRLLVGSSKMKYPKVIDTDPDSETYRNKVADKSKLVYNEYLTLSGIPERAHDYVLGSRSGIDWIIDRWYVKTDKASGIVNDVNQWGLEQGKPFYIVDLIKQVVTLSVRTVEIVESLPKLRFDERGTHVVSST